MRIAIVEDEPSQQTLLIRTLEQQLGREAAVHCQGFSDGLALQKVLRRESFDLVVLDWSVPGMDGLELLRWLRVWKESSVPVLMISSRGAEDDVAEALNSGADDYITKPFRPLELRARVLRLLKRRKPASPDAPLSIGRWTLDPVGHVVQYREAAGAEPESYALTSREFDLTMLLFTRLGQTVSRAHLLETAGYATEEAPSRTLDSHVYRLRKKLHLDARRGMILRTVYGQGYQLGLAEDEAS
ncbi:response regulator transcription factor [uncultured Variovorax sp.]|uniref:response regulator transcription factor n=1 Tax=uncultured Variovorax sp. TaxID=114708 RepID=UPI0025ECCD70|nr:response regulator transcription factor [uncultured Variovorax sp.]